jgi:tripartite-type tricarboxylate transporter receptor subunit TctC
MSILAWSISMVRLVLLAIIALLGILQSLTSAPAQTYPARTVRFIVPFGAASGTDITARLFADRLAVAAFIAANDDHTLLFAPVGTFTVHPYEHEKLPYDVERDLLPIASVSAIILAISSSASLKVDSLGELVELARAQPGKLNAAAANGNADFLLFGFLKSTGLQMAKVPYRDILQAPNDLAEGRIQVLMTSFAVVQPQMQTGRVKVLAVTSRKRAPSAPEVPTVTEAGYPALEMESLVGLFGPRGMPSELRERIAVALGEVAVADPVIATRLAATGQLVNIRGPSEFAAAIEQQRAKLAEIAKILGIKSAQ